VGFSLLEHPSPSPNGACPYIRGKFETEFSGESGLGSLIFRDRDKLSPRYVPSSLPHREAQLEALSSFYMYKLDRPGGSCLTCCQLIGPVGTGKTACILNFGRAFESEAVKRRVKLRHAYLNCKVDGSNRYKLYRNLLSKVAPEVSTGGMSPEEMLHQLLEYLEAEKMLLMITVDEVGYFYRGSSEPLIYDLTRLNEIYPYKPCRVVGVAFISRSLEFHGKLDESERSTLGRLIISFPKYTASQVRDILEERVEEAFQPGAVSEDVLDFVSEIVADPPINGDMRVALDLLYYAGTLAENMGAERVTPEHIRRVYGETHPAITTQDIIELDVHEKLTLYALLRLLEGRASPYATLSEIRDEYEFICEERGLEPKGCFEELMQELLDRQIVEMKSLLKFTICDVPAGKLRAYLNGLLRRLER